MKNIVTDKMTLAGISIDALSLIIDRLYGEEVAMLLMCGNIILSSKLGNGGVTTLNFHSDFGDTIDDLPFNRKLIRHNDIRTKPFIIDFNNFITSLSFGPRYKFTLPIEWPKSLTSLSLEFANIDIILIESI